ncbi:MAG: type II secretion system F family protein, partial [Maricaulaceae bacterium]
MPSFRYRALGPDGRPETGQLEAPDRPAAVRRLASDGLTPTRITEAAANPVLDLLNVELTPKAGLKPAARAGLTRDLAGLAAASVPLDDALDLLGGGGGPIGEVARDLAQRLRGGASLSQAMAERADAFPRASVNLVRAGEESGDLAGALDRLAEMEEASEALKQKLISASIYPAFLILTAIGVIGVLIRIVVPQFAPIFDAAGRDQPRPPPHKLPISNAAADYGGFA